MVLNPNKVLRQNVLLKLKPAASHQFAFWIWIANGDTVDLRVMLRMKFTNFDQKDSICPPRKVCNMFKRPVAQKIRGTGKWEQVISEEFDMFGSYPEWETKGEVNFILFQLFTRRIKSGGEIRVANFEEVNEDFTYAPSFSMAPSSSPTNTVAENAAYVVKYAGEVRTIVRHPFQVDNTGEILPMDGSEEYQLCEVDEVEGRKIEYPNRMNFFLNGRCQQSKSI